MCLYCVGSPAVVCILAVACIPVVVVRKYNIVFILNVACCKRYCCCLCHCCCLHPDCGRHICCCWRPLGSRGFLVAGLSAIADLSGVTNSVVGVSVIPF
jgi:hypothetical protein